MDTCPNPVIILVNPQLGENIGTAARAMYNGGLTQLRLVRPKMGWPNPHAIQPAAGALSVLQNVEVFETVAEAIADLQGVFATTARTRDMAKPVHTPRQAAAAMHARHAQQERIGILFGPERTGLHNEDLSFADTLITVPLNPAYTSLNLAQAVLLIAYEWFQLTQQAAEVTAQLHAEHILAPKEELLGLFQHLEGELDRSGFLRVAHKRPTMVRNLRNIFLRASLNAQEVRTLRGVISDLVAPYYGDRSGQSPQNPAE